MGASTELSASIELGASPEQKARAEPRRRSRRRPILGRFLVERRGAVAVEFALIGPIFIALLGAILETALSFWAGHVLESALGDASRQLYTGQFQGANKTTTDKAVLLAKLRSDALCTIDGQPRPTVFNCADVKLDVRTIAQFTGGGATSPVSGGNWASGFGSNYTSPAAGDIVVVQAAVKYPVFFSLYNPNQATFSDGSRLLQAAVVFRTEPY